MIKVLLLTIIFLLFNACGAQSGSSDVSTVASQSNTIKKTSMAFPAVPMLGVLVSYENIQITSSDATWSEKLFGKEHQQLNHYYLEASGERFEFLKINETSSISNDGVVSAYLNKSHPNISVEHPNFQKNFYPDLKEALIQIDNFVDFSIYDSDANGYISNSELIITFIIAGYEDSFEGSHVRDGVWAHQSCMVYESEIAVLDGVSLMDCSQGGNFALFGELHNKNAPHDATIGIIAHELGHSTFSLPDLYNTANPNSGGIGYFGIMGAGTWTKADESEYAGQTPTHFSAWSKLFNGWITPDILNNTTATLHESSSTNFNIIKLPINNTNYYLLENRNNSGYDRGLNSLDGAFDGGVAIWRVDETQLTQENFLANSVNADSNSPGIALIEAGYIRLDGDGGHESALYYQGHKDYFLNRVSDISSRASTMTLNIN